MSSDRISSYARLVGVMAIVSLSGRWTLYFPRCPLRVGLHASYGQKRRHLRGSIVSTSQCFLCRAKAAALCLSYDRILHPDASSRSVW
jgi:hypothetical protein